MILLTGANSGIGYEAALRLAAQHHTLVLPCRTMDKSIAAILSIQQELPDAKLIAAECDLSSLSSIRAFAKALPSLIGNTNKLDTVCYNAGLSRSTKAQDVARTQDGFELTGQCGTVYCSVCILLLLISHIVCSNNSAVGTNHLGHFLLHHLLVPYLSPSANLVVTASAVHDPETKAGARGSPATLGSLEGFERDGKDFGMVDGSAFDPDKAYKDSKVRVPLSSVCSIQSNCTNRSLFWLVFQLCNILFTRELQRRLESDPSTKNMVVNCFNPGLIVSTGLFRNQGKVFTTVFDFMATSVFGFGETKSFGGGCLSYMATSVRTKGLYYGAPAGSVKYGDAAYGNQFTVNEMSKEAQDDITAQRLWELSERLVGISK